MAKSWWWETIEIDFFFSFIPEMQSTVTHCTPAGWGDESPHFLESTMCVQTAWHANTDGDLLLWRRSQSHLDNYTERDIQSPPKKLYIFLDNSYQRRRRRKKDIFFLLLWINFRDGTHGRAAMK
jgi:hypothetical protein